MILKYDSWPQRSLSPTDLVVGPCAWRATMLTGPHVGFALTHPSLVVVDADDEAAQLACIGRRLANLPVLLGVHEPTFVRRLPDLIHQRLQLLNRDRVEALVLWVEDATELKAGGSLTTLLTLREEGVAEHIGLATPDVRTAEWLAQNAAVRLLMFPYELGDQSARYRLLDAAREYGIACLSLPSGHSHTHDALRFSLGETARVLPVLEAPPPEDLPPMSEEEIDRYWQAYREAHAEPPALPRAQPPE